MNVWTLNSNELDRISEALDYAILKREQEERERFGNGESAQLAAWKSIRNKEIRTECR